MSVSQDYTIAEPIADRAPDKAEPPVRYFAVVKHKPWREDAGDPIPWLVTIYRGEAVESYWRGDEDEAQDALSEYLSQRVSSSD